MTLTLQSLSVVLAEHEGVIVTGHVAKGADSLGGRDQTERPGE